jgi:hypothetical protein
MSLKNRIRWLEGGEWESIKILYENLTYVPNSTQRVSFLTQDCIAIKKLLALRTGLGTKIKMKAQSL